MGNQFDVAAGARLESTGRAPSNDEIVPRFSLDDINQAFDNNEFCFYLQPKCNAETGAIVGAEALVRWNHPEYGLVSPGEFIPLLERESMVTRFDLFIWRSVCEMLSRWDGEGRNLVPVSVNVSMTDIEAIDVARVLGDLLDRFSIDARLLQVEITESAIAHNMDVVEETIRDLHARGIAVLMDDFGSAYSSLNMLKDINVDAIKLDMKFVDLNADNAAKGLKIIESVIDMAYQLRLSIIAEGAQTAEQVSKLRELGCMYIQGYYFYRPLTVGKMEDLLEHRPDDQHFWNISKDLMHRDYRMSTNGRSMLESSSLSAHIFEILNKGVAELSRLNLITGEYRTIKRDPKLPDVYADDFHDYCHALVSKRIIHPDDAGEFLKHTRLSDLRDQLFSKKKSEFTYFRSEVEAKTSVIAFGVLVPPDCSEANPWAVVLIGFDLSLDLIAKNMKEIYRQDSLTGLLNRNAYDSDVEQLRSADIGAVVCVYADMIGLHEVNNHLGHKQGNRMLCEFADAARAFFGDDRLYRIGGDEFVIISSAHTEAQTRKQLNYMRERLHTQGCEISVGVASSESTSDLPKIIEQAENEMRREKKEYYVRGGSKRQLRGLNKKLEDILVRNQDMESLLRHLNGRYSIACMVNLRTDSQRAIMVPDYFQKMLDAHDGSFKSALHDYCERLVAPFCKDSFSLLMDYDFIHARVESVGVLQYGYTRNDGEKFLLTIFADRRSKDETMWVFSKDDLPQVELELFES
ncbi:EAL domain-containing protein [Bifidobacterium pseudocatenulatum]|uniref:GGDEF domain-containing protein n=1 Tax=Bifidobacterium pseudocatenulatum TaxID=28026 RepID=UPI00115BF615|nr:GGDEF domain-containing protein [Bifidobacterium pseudocatenulatum]MZN78814.1 EAL domain-containing protein [Bifidobacterium pseudocatenulatum]MZN96749.1 EAL domain-containing protein [Bifidobacterium pseudocatenulatum]MZO00357.1 EAL domain-containing protein [Bifidobacterium pseudocatenulatum]MZO05732.1 EAL domain-containing protein [Bifidobacterium pseudocatenulatum]MZO07395.1 EAL domain-containing protein [Bifidobacterium pseudocatenulatum]